MTDGTPPTPVRPLWERFDAEPDKAWEAFRQYRDARPPRRCSAVIGHGNCFVSEAYNTWRWAERVDAYDRHLEKIFLNEREALHRQKARDVAAEHMAMLQAARHVAMVELDKLMDSASRSDVSIVRPEVLVKLMKEVVTLDRLIRGESTEITDHRADLSRLSIEDLRKLRELRQKMGQDTE